MTNMEILTQNQPINNFEFENFGSVRVTMIDGEPWFVGLDVCNILELTNTSKTIAGLDDDEKADVTISYGSQNRNVKVISESGLYELVFKSRKPEAKRFKKWVKSDVLPQIRKTGSYQPAPLSIEQQKDNVLKHLFDENHQKDKIIAEKDEQIFHLSGEVKQITHIANQNQEKADALDVITAKRTECNLRTAGKNLGLKSNKFQDWMHQCQYLYRERGQKRKLFPYSKYEQKQPYFKVKYSTEIEGVSYPQTYMTTLGLEYFAKKKVKGEIPKYLFCNPKEFDEIVRGLSC